MKQKMESWIQLDDTKCQILQTCTLGTEHVTVLNVVGKAGCCRKCCNVLYVSANHSVCVCVNISVYIVIDVYSTSVLLAKSAIQLWKSPLNPPLSQSSRLKFLKVIPCHLFTVLLNNNASNNLPLGRPCLQPPPRTNRGIITENIWTLWSTTQGYSSLKI